MEFCSFSSGSSGNSYMVRQGGTVLLVDCGISGKKIFAGLRARGAAPEAVSGILISHEHSDHAKSLRVVVRKTGCSAFMNAGTWACLHDKVPEDRQVMIRCGERFSVGEVQVETFALSHDAAEPMGYSFLAGGRKLSIMTDTGYVSDAMLEAVADADLLVLEANHDVNVLQMGPYPYALKRRILSEEGHLSNEAAAACILRLHEMKDKPRRILLAHLSHQNNTPEMARVTVSNMLEEEGLLTGGSVLLDVVTRDEISPLYEV